MNPVTQAALGYLRRGWPPVHVAPRTKRPTQESWPTWRPAADELVRRFDAGPANVGVVLGEPAGGLVDVDLDAPEAVMLAPRFLPPTMVFGRASKPRSHWLFIAPRATTTRRHDGEVLVEIRATGAQTVFPPSVHPSGEAIEWDPDLGDGLEHPRLVEAGELLESVVRLALAAILVRAGWPVDAACRKAIGEEPRTPSAAPARPRRQHHDRLGRARRYLAAMPPAISGQGGHAATFRAAAALVRGFALEEEEALALLTDEYNPRCSPPWSERDLRHKVESATRASLPSGYLLEGRRELDARTR